MKISVVIPVFNEGKSIGLVLDAIPKKMVHEVVVVDNGSTDDSVMIARSKGAKMVHESRGGYGRACLTGLRALDNPEVVVFLDGDYSDIPEELPQLMAPLTRGEADFRRAGGDDGIAGSAPTGVEQDAPPLRQRARRPATFGGQRGGWVGPMC